MQAIPNGGARLFTQQPHLQLTTALSAVEENTGTESRSALPQTGQQLAVVSTSSISLQEAEEDNTFRPEPRIDNFRDATPCEKAKDFVKHPMTIGGVIIATFMMGLAALLIETDSQDSQDSEDKPINRELMYGVFGGISLYALVRFACLGPDCNPREGPLADAINLRLPIDQPESDTPPVPTINNPTQVAEGTV